MDALADLQSKAGALVTAMEITAELAGEDDSGQRDKYTLIYFRKIIEEMESLRDALQALRNESGEQRSVNVEAGILRRLDPEKQVLEGEKRALEAENHDLDEALEDGNRALEEENQTLEKKKQLADQSLSALEADRRALEVDRRALDMDRQTLESDRQALESDQKILESTQKALKSEWKLKEEALATEKQHAKELSQASEREKAAYETKCLEIAEKTFALLEAEKKTSSERYAEGQKAGVELGTAIEKLKLTEAELKTKAAEAEALRVKVQDLTTTVEATNNSIAEKDREIAEKDREIARMRADINTLKGENEDAAKNIDSANSELAEAKEALAGKEAEVEHSKTQVESLQGAANRRNEEIAGLKQALSKSKEELRAETAKLEDWETSARLVLQLPQARYDTEVDEEEDDEFNEKRSWQEEVRFIMENILRYRPIVADSSSLTPAETIMMRMELVKDMFNLIMEESSRANLDEFKQYAHARCWYCFEQVARQGHRSLHSPVGDDGRCQVHASCVLIKRPSVPDPYGILCKKVPSEH